MRRVVAYTIACWFLSLVLVAFVAALDAYARANPRIRIPDANRARFVNVAVLLDSTGSMSDLHLRLAKQITISRVVPAIGIGDKLSCYAVGPDFGISNLICGGTFEGQPPQYRPERRAEVLRIVASARGSVMPGRVRSPLYALVNELDGQADQLTETRQRWARQIEAAGRPKRRGTNLCDAIDALEAYFAASSDPYEDKILVIISDMVQDSAACRTRTASRSGDAGVLSGVKIVLVYPHDSAHDWTAILSAWKRYFGDRPIDVVPFSVALNEEMLLAPGPLMGLEAYRVDSFRTHLRSHAGLGRWAVAVTFVAALALSLAAWAFVPMARSRHAGADA